MDSELFRASLVFYLIDVLSLSVLSVFLDISGGRRRAPVYDRKKGELFQAVRVRRSPSTRSSARTATSSRPRASSQTRSSGTGASKPRLMTILRYFSNWRPSPATPRRSTVSPSRPTARYSGLLFKTKSTSSSSTMRLLSFCNFSKHRR